MSTTLESESYSAINEPSASCDHSTPISIIEPRRGLRFLDWKELYAYRDLFFFLTWRSIKVRYAQSSSR